MDTQRRQGAAAKSALRSVPLQKSGSSYIGKAASAFDDLQNTTDAGGADDDGIEKDLNNFQYTSI